MSVYRLKPAFQNLLRPGVRYLYHCGVTANQVTLVAMLVSLLVAGVLCIPTLSTKWFLLLPIWMLLRMALNAIDGMLAREFKQKSALGAYLNELSDVIADAALLLPFVFLPQVSPVLLIVVIFVAMLSEFSGVLGVMVGASRRYDGPMGKSDRALLLGVMAVLWAYGWITPLWLNVCFALMLLLLCVTSVNRIGQGVSESANKGKEENEQR
ncbi:CDP-alcohol phosphatidyltransferase family protein [Vibrio sp. S4M6]|uniref:CDP-alcohol phosphatidyltransferase family protein n=1 Tax=Vibrio sinus TaxID=2946865 RepID=UPI002029E34B|nr:CDP-alcohol phosphatidyltransferase family protein [Vibrio sinus]MCL9782970.1 CDP-alcohol phosphatidyltransferase family protein [Vibrio sinus]